jgi:hypothetical protein
VVSAANSLVGSSASDEVGSRGVTVLSNGNFLVNSPYWANYTGAVTFGSGTSGVCGIVSAANSLVGSSPNDFVGGNGVTALPNGNYIVDSPSWSGYEGAVTFGNGISGVSGVIGPSNSMVGSSVGDGIGGNGVTVLGNSNYVVNDPYWSNQTGAVTFGSGTAGISGIVSDANSLVGSSAGDQVGYNPVTLLSNDNYVVNSPYWANGAGAATFGSGTSGIIGVVSAANSLIGSSENDGVDSSGATALSNGNYVVASPSWSNGEGAATFGSGTSGVSGVISAANSLVGSSPNDNVGGGVTALNNGNYLVNSSYWAHGAGAATFGNGTSGVSGAVSAANSLVGSSPNDHVGYYPVTLLKNGNYVVNSPYWANGAGAVTFGSGISGVCGVVSAANSLVGSSASDQVGSNGVTALRNGNYVVASHNWSNGAGAATFGSGTSGVSGVISAANSLVGSSANEYVGGSVTALSNGNYLVLSATFSYGDARDAGAVTFGNGTTGISGVVSAANSLVGSSAMDYVGQSTIMELANGNYVVINPYWSNYTGAVTFGRGTTGVSGVISATNSLVGSLPGDSVGVSPSGTGVTVLSNGNYVVASPFWLNSAGAVTFGNGTTGISGVISAANSLVGSSANDQIGYNPVGPSVTELSNGNYVVSTPFWSNGAAARAGEVTFGSGTSGVSGVVSAANSLVGSQTDDLVGSFPLTLLSNGNFVVGTPDWSNGTAGIAGAATFGNGTTGVSGVISAANSMIGFSSFLDTVAVDNLNNTYYGAFPSFALNGRVLVASQVDGRPGPAAANIAIASSSSTQFFGQSVTLTATVAAADPETGNPTGTVTFLDGTTQLATATLNSSGQASFTTSTLPAGTHTITARYSGDSVFLFSTSVALTQSVLPSIYVVNPTAKGALTLSGNASLNIPGLVQVDSTSPQAISASGNTQLNASAIDVAGGFRLKDNATFSVAPGTGISLPDPLAYLTDPSAAGLPNCGSINLKKGSLTINPGIYSSLNVSGTGFLTLNPGIYVIQGGGLVVTGGGSVNGTGVLIYNAGGGGSCGGDDSGGITLCGKGKFNLTAAVTGPYAGVVIFQARNNTRQIDLDGNASGGIGGTIYAANANLDMSGNTQLQASLIVGTLTLKGDSALSQMAAGSDASGDMAIIGDSLRAGDLSVYINDPNSYFSTDEIARINDAVSGLDSLLAPFSVTITLVSDPSVANVVLDNGTTSASGTAADGVLGCFNPAASLLEITILQGWNWYAGADATQIGSGQYDFQTTITHELGHALGLGHNPNPSSPMYAWLDTGMANRTMTVPDLNIPDPPDGADPLTSAAWRHHGVATAAVDEARLLAVLVKALDYQGKSNNPDLNGVAPVSPSHGYSNSSLAFAITAPAAEPANDSDLGHSVAMPSSSSAHRDLLFAELGLEDPGSIIFAGGDHG